MTLDELDDRIAEHADRVGNGWRYRDMGSSSLTVIAEDPLRIIQDYTPMLRRLVLAPR